MSSSISTASSTVTGGLLSPAGSGLSSSSSLLTGGMSSDALANIPSVNFSELAVTAAAPQSISSLNITDVAAVAASSGTTYDANGNPVNVTAASIIQVTPTTTLSFDPTTLQGVLASSVSNLTPTSLSRVSLSEDVVLYSGSDIRIMIEVADALGPTRWAKQFFECTTLTISIHRVKDPARACGYIGAKGYSRGGRTIAGTLVLTELGKDALYEFLSAFALRDQSKDSQYVKVDQLPPFNISLLFANEAGYASSRRLMGVDMVTDGTVYSVNDGFTERTISYVAADMTPLLPLDLQSIQNPPTGSNPATDYESTPASSMQAPLTKNASTSELIAYA